MHNSQKIDRYLSQQFDLSESSALFEKERNDFKKNLDTALIDDGDADNRVDFYNPFLRFGGKLLQFYQSSDLQKRPPPSNLTLGILVAEGGNVLGR
jgi:hypothetical protein